LIVLGLGFGLVGAECGPPPAPAFLCQATPDPGRPYASLDAPSAPNRLPALYPLVEALWPIRQIPVCWDDQAMQNVSADDREIVRQAAVDSWNAALSEVDVPADQQYQFVGFDACSADANAAANGIHIVDGTGDPHTINFGKYLAGQPGGMVLNFTFKEWSSGGCHDFNPDDVARRYCVYSIAAHEFGHALGLAHEQNRTDTPTTCTDAQQGGNGDIRMGIWDSASIMNYCNPHWNDAGILSANDQSGIRSLYYPQAAANWCASQTPPAPMPSPWPSPSAAPDSASASAPATTSASPQLRISSVAQPPSRWSCGNPKLEPGQ
jgi:hypothetical protein